MKNDSTHWLRRLVGTPALRLAWGMSSLVVSVFLMADLAFDLLPDQTVVVRKLRARIAENLAIQTAALLEAGDARTLERVYREQLARETSMLSVAVRRGDGSLVAQAGDHVRHWVPPATGRSSLDHVQVPLSLGDTAWGHVELSFRNAAPQNLREWLRHPPVMLALLLGIGSFIAFFLYLRRVLSHLDPSSVIPDRVRSAFDVFSGGVMVVDKAGRIMLANTALKGWMGVEEAERLIGRNVPAIAWFARALPEDASTHPWAQCIASGRPTEGEHLEFIGTDGAPIRVIANCAPILDGGSKVRGCLVTFDNVTHLDQLNAQLLSSMAELSESKSEVERKNEELVRLATRDALTGCFNRRALYERFAAFLAEAREKGTPLCCIMSDIDHFKSFNDKYGHAVGDQVLQSTAHRMAAAIRERDLLARYGGEEFCVVLPNTDIAEARRVAERLRHDVEAYAGPAVRTVEGLRITSSFGIAVFDPSVEEPGQLIDLADQALYVAKKSGRNRVTVYGTAVEEEPANAPPAPEHAEALEAEAA